MCARFTESRYKIITRKERTLKKRFFFRQGNSDGKKRPSGGHIWDRNDIFAFNKDS